MEKSAANYILVTAGPSSSVDNCDATLKHGVNIAIAQGFQPLGGPTVTMNQNLFLMVQAMVQ